jgi:FkbM family methyltransferase
VSDAALRRRTALALGAVGRRYTYPGQRAFSLVARVLRRFPPEGELTYRDADGYLRRADLHDHMESLAFVGRHRLPKSVTADLRPGDWALDVGANVGSVTGQLCRAVGATGRIWAFEPIPRNVARLTGFREANDLFQLEVFDCALSSTKGRATISLAKEGFSGHASFTASWIDDGEMDVPTDRLDDLTSELDDSAPLRLMKIDVEGFEREVIAGAEATIRRFRPSIFCEFNDIILRDAGSSSHELLSAFGDLGYCVAPTWSRRATNLTGRNVDLLMTPKPGG